MAVKIQMHIGIYFDTALDILVPCARECIFVNECIRYISIFNVCEQWENIQKCL